MLPSVKFASLYILPAAQNGETNRSRRRHGGWRGLWAREPFGRFRGGLLRQRGNDQLLDAPDMVGHAHGHRRSRAQRGVDAAKVVVANVERHRGRMVALALAESVGQPREATVSHADVQVVALDVGGGDLVGVRFSGNFYPLRAHDARWRVAMGDGNHLRRSRVFLHDLAVVHVRAKGFFDGADVGLVTVA